MTLNFGNLIVFSAGSILLFINDLVVDDPVGLITCERFWIKKTVTPRSRGSAQEILDLSNHWRPGTEEKVEDEMLGVHAEQETSRGDEIKRLFWTHNQVNLGPQMWYKE